MAKELITDNSFVEISKHTWKEGEKFPKHAHRDYNKIIIVSSGRIMVHTWIDEKKTSHILESGQHIGVPANTFRQITVMEDSVVYKVYYRNMSDVETKVLKNIFNVYGNKKQY